MTSPKPRLRFAPSPTGYLHIGGARTALYNYLLAKQWGGTFILRIEDTDRERSTPKAIEAILEGMRWLGLNWDEGPYFQTKRFDIYEEHIQKLLHEKKAYPCFCATEELEAKRKAAMADKRKPMYDRTCFKLSSQDVAARIAVGKPHCIRFYSPDEGEITVKDAIKGDVVVANRELDDLVIRRTDGYPTYNFTVVVDDVTMGMTHIVRGDDHLNNTPRQIQLYQSFGYPLPTFAHVPMILGTDKKRLSKRHGATSVMAYHEMGFLPDALINYLVRLGWSYKDQEVFTRQELIEKFSLESVSGSAGVFNPEKLLWLNGVYMREAKAEALAGLMPFHLRPKGIEVDSQDKLIQAVAASQEKVKTLVEMAEYVECFFKEVEPDEELKKQINEAVLSTLKSLSRHLELVDPWDQAGLEGALNQVMQETGLGLGKVAGPLRIVLTGKKVTPGIYDVLKILGRENVLRRIKKYTH